MPKIIKKTRRFWEKTAKNPENPYTGYAKDKKADSFYVSVAWRRLRKWFLADPANRLCAICIKEGEFRPTTVVDHIRPINQGGSALDANNLQGLCTYHHAAKSATEHKAKNQDGKEKS